MKVFDRYELEKLAFHIRKDIVETIISNGEGHAGGALSCTDALAVLYGAIMNRDSADTRENDKFILSAGHKCLALYSALAETGALSYEDMKTYNLLGTKFPGHPDMSKIAEVDFSTGSLGHGLPLSCGFAKAAQITKSPYRTFVLMGDGEQGEGSNWEAAAFAAFNKLDNLIAILDENSLQINGRTNEICMPTPLSSRYEAFGWSVVTVDDGNDVEALYNAFQAAPYEKGKPSLVVMKTKKGKGISFMEDNIKYHHWNPDEAQKQQALSELAIQELRWKQ